MGKILFMPPVAADKRLSIEKLTDLIERRDELSRREEVTLLEAFRSLGCLDENAALEQQVISVHLAAFGAIEAFHDTHDEEPTDEQLKEMRVKAARNMGAENVATLLEHDPDRFQGFIERFFERVYERIKDEQPSKGGANG